MSASEETASDQLEGALLNSSKNSEGWSITDLSLGSSDRLVISGCKHATGETFLSIFLIEASDPTTDAKYLYSREFNKTYNPDLRRLVSFLDELNLVTCFDNLVEKISIVNDEVVQSSKLVRGGASCLFVKEQQTFIGFRKSCDVAVLDSDLSNVQLITLNGLEDGNWPLDLVVVRNTFLVCSFGCISRRVLSLAEKDGQFLREYTNPASGDSVPLSLTVSADCDMLVILWNSPPQLTIYSFLHGHSLVIANVEPAERIRSVGQDKLVMVDGKGEMKFFLFEEFFTFENLETVLSSLLSPDDLKELMDFFGVTLYQVARASNTKVLEADEDFREVSLRDLLECFEEDGTIHPGDVTELIEAFTQLGKDKTLISPLEAYQKYAGHTGNDLKAMTPPCSAPGQERQGEEVERKESAENEGTSSMDEDDDSMSWTSDEEPLSPCIPEESQRGETRKSVPSSDSQGRSLQSTDDPCVSGNEDVSRTNRKRTLSVDEKCEDEPDQMDVSDADVTLKDANSDLKVDSETTVDETITMMMETIQALKQQSGLILSYLRMQPSSSPCSHLHLPPPQNPLDPPSSHGEQTLPSGPASHEASAHQPFQTSSQTHPPPISQLQAMVYHSQALQQAGPGLPVQSGPYLQVTQQVQAPNNAQPSQTPAQKPVVHPLQMSPPGQQPQSSQAQQPQLPQPPPPVLQFQASQPSPSPQCLPLAHLEAQAQADPSPPQSQPQPIKQSSCSVPSSQPNLSQPSVEASQITQPSQKAQHSQPAHHAPFNQPPQLTNPQIHPQVPVYPHPPVSHNFYNFPVRLGSQRYTNPIVYHPIPPNMVRLSHPARYPFALPTPVPVNSSAQLTAGMPAQHAIHNQWQSSVTTTSESFPQPSQSKSTPSTQPSSETLSQGVSYSPVNVTTSSQMVIPSVSSWQLQASLNTQSLVASNDGVSPALSTALIGYGFEALPQKVKTDILRFTDSMQSLLNRNSIVRILADFWFTDQERMECNCSGKNGYKPFSSDKLQRIRQLMSELCTKHWLGYPLLDESMEWRRLCKVIDSHNRGHRTRIRMRLERGVPR